MNRRRVLGILLGARVYALLVMVGIFLHVSVDENLKVFLFTQPGDTPAERREAIEHSFWERLTPLDGQFYRDVAHRGYRETIQVTSLGSQRRSGNYAFFPLLPALLWVGRTLSPALEIPLALVLIWTAGAVGLYAVFEIATRFTPKAMVPVVLLLTFPSACFQYVLYTEGLFLLLSAAGIWAALNRRHALAMLAGALAGLARPQGVVLSVFFFFELLRADVLAKPPRARSLSRFALTCLSPWTGFLTLAVVSHALLGDPLGFIHVQRGWGRELEAGGFLAAFRHAFAYGGPPLDLLGFCFGLALLPVIWKKLPLPWLMYALALIAMPLATGSVLSMGRFMSVSIPHFLALGLLLENRRVLLWLLASTFFMLQNIAATTLLAWKFVG